MEGIFEDTYKTHHHLFVDQVERKLQQSPGSEVQSIEKLGDDILCEVPLGKMGSFLLGIKSDPFYDVESFRNIKLFWKGQIPYALVAFYSFNNNFNFLIKTELDAPEIKTQYRSVIDTVSKHYPAAGFFKKKKLLQKENMDFSLYSQPLSGLDCFDIYGSLDDDLIEKVIIDTSVADIHQKGLLKNQNLLKLLSFMGVFDYNAGVFPELGLCMGIENILQMKIPERAQSIRMVICELSRISSHLESIANMLEVLGYDLVLSLILTEKEKSLNLIETVTGARILPNFIRVGGVKKDLERDKISFILETLPAMLNQIKSIESRMLENILVFNRLKDIGRINRTMAKELGLSGPNLRSAGIRKDARKDKAQLAYDRLSFTVPLGRYGDCFERVSIRFKEIYQSIKLIKGAIDDMPDGGFRKINNLTSISLPDKALLSGVECPHGLFQVYLETGNSQVEALVVMGPSINSLMAAERVLEGSRLEDLDIILASLDISPGEIIRNRWYK